MDLEQKTITLENETNEIQDHKGIIKIKNIDEFIEFAKVAKKEGKSIEDILKFKFAFCIEQN